MKKYAGFLYLFFILLLWFGLHVVTKGVNIESINLPVSIGIYFVATRLILKPAFTMKFYKGNKIMCFIPLVQEFILLEEGILQILYLISYGLIALFGIFAFAVPYSLYQSIGLAPLQIDSVTFILTVLMIVLFVVNRVIFGIRANQLSWSGYISMGSNAFYSGVTGISKVLSSVFVLIPGIRNIAFCFMISGVKN